MKPNEKTLTLPPSVLRVLHTLERAGYPAYLVGGSLRDALRGVTPHDFDITTPALPARMQAIFGQAGLHTVETGLKHGTLTVIVDGENIECTTYRVETTYSDGRHPDAVRFTDRIADDLCRRDFTVNAIACRIPAAAQPDFPCERTWQGELGESAELVDLFGGREDLEAGVLRCVGDPAVRFDEDALRIARCVRFAVQLGFCVEETTEKALAECREGLGRVSVERRAAELLRMLESPMPLWEGLQLAWESGLFPYLLPEAEPSTRENVLRTALLPNRVPLRLAQLLTPTYEAGGADAVRACCRALRLPVVLIKQICSCLVGAALAVPDSDAALRRMMAETGEQAEHALWLAGLRTMPDTALLKNREPGAWGREAILPALWQEALQRCRAIRARGDCLCVAALALHGDDLVRRGLRGSQVGRAQAMLLQAVLDDPEKNTRSALTALLDNAQRDGTL